MGNTEVIVFKIKPNLLIIIIALFILIMTVNVYSAFYIQPQEKIKRILYDRSSPIKVAEAFATALRLKHEVAYELADNNLDSKVTEWMETYRVRECSFLDRGGDIEFASGSLGKYTVTFTCVLKNDGRLFIFTVTQIELARDLDGELQVINWLSARESID